MGIREQVRRRLRTSRILWHRFATAHGRVSVSRRADFLALIAM